MSMKLRLMAAACCIGILSSLPALGAALDIADSGSPESRIVAEVIRQSARGQGIEVAPLSLQSDPAAALAALQRGDVDLLAIPAGELPAERVPGPVLATGEAGEIVLLMGDAVEEPDGLVDTLSPLAGTLTTTGLQAMAQRIEAGESQVAVVREVLAGQGVKTAGSLSPSTSYAVLNLGLFVLIGWLLWLLVRPEAGEQDSGGVA